MALALWVCFCAFCNCAGWILSAIHQLNFRGYAVLFGFALAGLLIFRRHIFRTSPGTTGWTRWRRRFSRPLPLAFLIVGAMAILGGVIYGPNNYDALAYRIPRMLHWLAEGQWHWIHTEFNRLNSRTCGVEWVSVPLILFTKTDRLLFLINVASFVLLPGLVFALFTRLGVRPRVAWHWMWIVPTGYSFLLQVGGVGNDLFGALFPIAALLFALRARETQKASDLWLSIISAGMVTASKSSNLPLLLPWAVALLPSWRLALRHPLGTAVICAGSLLASIVPTAILNTKYCGDWTGLAAENASIGAGSPWLYLGANTVLIFIQNFVPPVFPFSNSWNHAMRVIVPPWLNQKLEAAFEPGGAHFTVGEMEMEEHAGLGFGVSMFILISLIAVWWLRRRRRALPQTDPDRKFHLLVLACVGVAFLVFLSKSGLTTLARLISPYYCLFLPLFLRGNTNALLVKQPWWHRTALGVFIIAAGLLVVSAARPLWPANTILSRVQITDHTNHLLVRAKTVYSVYSERNDGFAPAREILPPGLKILGFMSFDDPEASLWRPFGARRIEHIMVKDTADDLKKRGVEYALVNSYTYAFFWRSGPPFETWLAQHNAELVRTIPLTLRAGRGPIDWYLVRLK